MSLDASLSMILYGNDSSSKSESSIKDQIRLELLSPLFSDFSLYIKRFFFKVIDTRSAKRIN